MKLDSHQHFWIYNPVEYDWIDNSMANIRRDFLPVHLAVELNNYGFDGSIAVQARQSIEETEWLLSMADSYSLIKGVVGWVDLRLPDVETQLSTFAKHPKFVGVRHVVQGEPEDDFILGADFNRGVALLKKFNLTYDILVFPKQLPYAVKFVEKHPEITFVLDHIAKPYIKKRTLSPWKEDIKNLSAFPNVYCKVSGMVTEANWNNWTTEDFKPYMDVVFDAFGVDKVMIGSDWPVCLVAGDYSKVMSIVSNYMSGFFEEDKNKILGLNCMKAYRVTP
jgi:L-fuconolactonase